MITQFLIILPVLFATNFFGYSFNKESLQEQQAFEASKTVWKKELALYVDEESETKSSECRDEIVFDFEQKTVQLSNGKLRKFMFKKRQNWYHICILDQGENEQIGGWMLQVEGNSMVLLTHSDVEDSEGMTLASYLEKPGSWMFVLRKTTSEDKETNEQPENHKGDVIDFLNLDRREIDSVEGDR